MATNIVIDLIDAILKEILLRVPFLLIRDLVRNLIDTRFFVSLRRLNEFLHLGCVRLVSIYAKEVSLLYVLLRRRTIVLSVESISDALFDLVRTYYLFCCII